MKNSPLTKESKQKIGRFLSAWGAVLSTVIAFLIFSILQPAFFCSWSNIESILRAASITVVISMGMTFAFSCGVFDLSVGTIATLGAAFSLVFCPLWPFYWPSYAACLWAKSMPCWF